MPPQHILVPLDFSDCALRALDYAVTLGRQVQASVTLLHVVQSLPPTATGAVPSWLTTHLALLEDELRRHLEDYRQRVAAAGLAVEVILSHGVPVQEVLAIATAQQIDLIVIGSHGRTGLPHTLLGSMAEKIMRLAPCPVLVVR